MECMSCEITKQELDKEQQEVAKQLHKLKPTDFKEVYDYFYSLTDNARKEFGQTQETKKRLEDFIEGELWKSGFVEIVHKLKRPEVARILSALNPTNILDLGAGSGALFKELFSLGYNGNATALDKEICLTLEERAEEYGFGILKRDFNELITRALGYNFDVVVGFSALHYLPYEKLDKLIKKINAKYYVVVEPFDDIPENKSLAEKLKIKNKELGEEGGIFNEKQLDKTFAANGFSEVYSHTFEVDILGRRMTVKVYAKEGYEEEAADKLQEITKKYIN